MYKVRVEGKRKGDVKLNITYNFGKEQRLKIGLENKNKSKNF